MGGGNVGGPRGAGATASGMGGGARRRGGRKAAPEGRWVREVKGILALALAAFALVALWSFDPRLHVLDQTSPVGPVGSWLGWASFWAFGYAGYLFPVLLALYGVGAFVRSRLAQGWPAAAGLALRSEEHTSELQSLRHLV